jgi:hypothetical protein
MRHNTRLLLAQKVLFRIGVYLRLQSFTAKACDFLRRFVA